MLENDKRRSLHEQLERYYFSGIQQVAASLFEQLVRHSIFGRQQVAASLFEQLVCYSIFLEYSKWQLLYLSSLYVIGIFWKTASGSFFI